MWSLPPLLLFFVTIWHILFFHLLLMILNNWFFVRTTFIACSLSRNRTAVSSDSSALNGNFFVGRQFTSLHLAIAIYDNVLGPVDSCSLVGPIWRSMAGPGARYRVYAAAQRERGDR